MKVIISKLTLVCLLASLGSVWCRHHGHVNLDGAKVEVNTTSAQLDEGASRIVDAFGQLNAPPFNWLVAFFASRHKDGLNKHLLGFGIRTSKKLVLLPQYVESTKLNMKINNAGDVDISYLYDLPISLNIDKDAHPKTGVHHKIHESSIGGTSMILAEATDPYGANVNYRPKSLKIESDKNKDGKTCFIFGFKQDGNDTVTFAHVRVDPQECDGAWCTMKINNQDGRHFTRICGYASDYGSPIICDRGKLTYIVYPDESSGCSANFKAVKAAYLYQSLKEHTQAIGDEVDF